MSKVASIYWENNQAVTTPGLRPKSKTRMKSNRESASPPWFFLAVIAFTGFMICLTVNFRAFSELNTEIEQHQKLTLEVEQLSDGNFLLKQEIRNLKTDPKTIETEARKLGMGRPNE